MGMAPKHLQEVAVPGEVEGTVVTAEQGESITTPLVGAKVETPAAVADPKKEKDDKTLLYLVLGVGGFIGLIFATS